MFYHSIANFWVVSLTFVSVLTLQFNSDSVAQHNLYVKEHKVRAEKSSHRPMDRTLFVLNIPPYCSEVHTYALFIFWNANINPTPTLKWRWFLLSVFQGIVKELFSQFGSVVSVELMDHPSSLQESGPKLSKFFKPVEKQVDFCFSSSVIIQLWNMQNTFGTVNQK